MYIDLQELILLYFNSTRISRIYSEASEELVNTELTGNDKVKTKTKSFVPIAFNHMTSRHCMN